MASEEEKAAWKSPVKFKLASMFGRIVTPAMPVGFQSIREFHGISRCWDAEDQRESGALLCGQHLTFSEPGGRSCGKKKLRSNGAEISDFEISCFGSVFRVLVVVRSSYPSLWYIFSTSQWNKRHTKHEARHQNQWTVSEFECFFSPLGSKNRFLSHGFSMFFLCFSWAAALVVRSFPPILIHIIFSRSQWYQRHTKHGIKQKRPKIKQLNLSFPIFCYQKRPFSPWK